MKSPDSCVDRQAMLPRCIYVYIGKRAIRLDQDVEPKMATNYKISQPPTGN